MGLRRLLVKMLDPGSGVDGQAPVISGGKFVIGNVPTDVEAVIDAVAAALVAGTGMTVTYDDVAGTITLTASGGGGSGGGFPAFTGLAAAGCTYGANMADFAAPYGPCGVRKSNDGDRVQLRGVLQSSAAIAANATILTLPVGLRPAKTYMKGCMSNSGASIRLDVKATGVVTTVTAISSGGYVSLDDIEFATT